MDIETFALLAELKFKILETAILIKNNCTKEEAIESLLEAAKTIDNSYPAEIKY